MTECIFNKQYVYKYLLLCLLQFINFSWHGFNIYMQGPDVCIQVYNDGIYNVTPFTTCDCDDLRITVHTLSRSANVNPHKSENVF